jgi:hypothetical protein
MEIDRDLMQWATRAPESRILCIAKTRRKTGKFPSFRWWAWSGVLQFVFNLSTAKMRVASHLL